MHYLAKTIKTISGSKLLLIASTIIDIMFYAAFGYASAYFYSILLPSMDSLVQLTGETLKQSIANITPEQAVGLSSQLDVFFEHYYIVLNNIIYIIASFAALWLITQGISWYLLHRTKKTKLKTYLAYFILYTLLAFSVFFAALYAAFKAMFLFREVLFGSFDASSFSVMLAALLLLFLYFLLNAYASIGKSLRKTLFSLKTPAVFIALTLSITAIIYLCAKFIPALYLPFTIFPFITLAKVIIFENAA
jgi:hypothetical protein